VSERIFEKVGKRVFVMLLLVAASALAAAAETTPKTGKAAIASAHKLATEAGFEVIAQGGNAFDAAIAVAAALSVVEPHSSGIGGGGFFLLHRASDGKDTMVDARETAPAAVDGKKYLDAQGKLDADKARNGPLAAAIPGEPAGLVWLAQHYGKLPLAKSFAPAIRIAREGFQPDERFLEGIATRIDVIKRFPGSAALYLDNCAAPKPGWVFKNPDIATTFELIATKGNEGFISVERFQSLTDPSKLLSLSFWQDEEAVKKWRNNLRHRESQARGRDGVFADYRLRVAAVLRDYGNKDRAEVPEDSKLVHDAVSIQKS